MCGGNRPQLGFVLTLALICAGCAQPAAPSYRWVKPEPAPDQNRLDADFTACQGSAQAQMSSIPPQGQQPPRKGIGLTNATANYGHIKMTKDTFDAVLHGCMADRGWLVDRR